MQLPFLNDAFGTTPLALADWLICVGLASVVLWADEAKKLLERGAAGRLGRGAARAASSAGPTPYCPAARPAGGLTGAGWGRSGHAEPLW